MGVYLPDIALTYDDFKGYLQHTLVSIDVQHIGWEDLSHGSFEELLVKTGDYCLWSNMCDTGLLLYNVQYYVLFIICPFRE